MAKQDFTQEKVNTIFEAAARAAYQSFGFNPTAILGFEMSPASDLYISPKLPGARNWFFLKSPMGEESLVFNSKTAEILLVESEDSWSEKTQKKLSKISKADLKAWNELTGGKLVAKSSRAKAPKKAAAKPARKAVRKTGKKKG
ncbi:MAG: hypothetical protein NDJ89_14860 [Oligoflexia bacterium]|nr:hypothetical protein [Oligoflexia bacterium]